MKKSFFLRSSALMILFLGLVAGLLSSCRAKYTHKVSKYGIETSRFKNNPSDKS